VNYSDYTIDDMVEMFGAAAVCVNGSASPCQPKSTASQWNAQVHGYMNGGHCDGFTTTSLRFFKDLDNPAAFQGGANTTHDLLLSNARRHIAYYWVLCVPNPVAAARDQALQKTPSQVLDQLRSAMSGGSDPMNLLVYSADGQEGHSITPYAIQEQGGGEWWVKVYDNNHPDDANRHVVINTIDNTWSYNLGWTTWSGDANIHSLGVISISTYAQPPQCPWCGGLGAQSEPALGQVWLAGEGHLLVTDSQGQRIGYIGDQFVNEVPGAFGSVPPGGLGIPQEPIYYLPLTNTYTILLDGQTLTQTETVAVTQFGPGYVASVDDITLSPTSQDQLTVAPDGTQLTYRPNSSKEATLTLALDSTGQSNQFQIKGADVGASQVVTLAVDLDNSLLAFSNVQNSGGEYDLDIDFITAAGERTFTHAGVVIAATDTHYVDYNASNCSAPVTLNVDHGSNGTIDETLVLANQANPIYLPLILRKR
jgi:hypothetical protein